MNLTLRIFLIILLIIQLILIVHHVKYKKISMKYANLWIIVIICLILVCIFPSLVMILSQYLGFEVPSNMVFLIGFFVLSYICFTLSISISLQNIRIKNLVQEISILKKEIQSLERKEEKND